MDEMNIHTKLAHIQNALKSPKDQKAQQYRYRNIEDINEAVKPLALEFGCSIRYTDRFIVENDMLICESHCILDDGTAISLSAYGLSIINTKPKFMSIEQSCGAASSYARKYAACGLFAIDSSENDPDRTRDMKPEPTNDPLIDAKNRLWVTVKQYCSAFGMEPKELYSVCMEGIANNAMAITDKANELLTELKALDA